MGNLGVHYLQSPDAQAGSLLPLEIFSTDMKPVTTAALEVGATSRITLDSGTYLLRVHLLDGEVLTAEAKIGPDQSTLILLADDQAATQTDMAEDLAHAHQHGDDAGTVWGRIGGNRLVRYIVSSITAPFNLDIQRVDPGTVPRTSSKPSSSGPAAVEADPFAPLLQRMAFQGLPDQVASEVSLVLKRIATSPAPASAPSSFPLTFELWNHRPYPAKGSHGWMRQAFPDRHAIRYSSDAGPLATLEIPLGAGQHWLRVANEELGLSKFAALPPSNPARVLVVQDQPSDDPMDDPLRIVVSSSDPQAESMLLFLCRGQFGSARAIAAKAFEKTLAAGRGSDASDAVIGAIAGYYLLLAGRLHDLEKVSDALASTFDWLPDGSVIHAWNQLRRPRSDVNSPRSRLIETVKRGIPLYTQGLRLLFDGLCLFARNDPSDERIHGMLDIVRPYADMADSTSSTTIFHGQNPFAPKRPVTRPAVQR